MKSRQVKIFSREYLQNSTPSRKDGVDAVKEQQLRKTYYNFIRQLVKELKLPAWILETATVYAHRFFAVRSISKNDRFLVATASVFLACKVEESPRGLRDLAYVMFKTKNANKPEELAKLRSNTDAVLAPHMENILLAERALLYTLSFELGVDSQYGHVVSSLKKLGITTDKPFWQLTQNMLNDSLATTLCLQYESSKLVSAAMYQVAKLLPGYTLPIPEGTTFTEYFNITQAELDDITRQMMLLYDKPAKGAAAAAAAATTPALPLPPRPNGMPLPSLRPVIILTDDGQALHQQPSSSRAQTVSQAQELEEGELPDADGATSPVKPEVPAVAPAPAAAAAPAASSETLPLPSDSARPPACQGRPGSQPAEAPAHAAGQSHGSAPAMQPAAGPPQVSPARRDSDAENDDVGHAAGSGDQNNHNERAMPGDMGAVEQQPAAQPQASLGRKSLDQEAGAGSLSKRSDMEACSGDVSRKRTRSPGAEEEEEDSGALQRQPKSPRLPPL